LAPSAWYCWQLSVWTSTVLQEQALSDSRELPTLHIQLQDANSPLLGKGAGQSLGPAEHEQSRGLRQALLLQEPCATTWKVLYCMPSPALMDALIRAVTGMPSAAAAQHLIHTPRPENQPKHCRADYEGSKGPKALGPRTSASSSSSSDASSSSSSTASSSKRPLNAMVTTLPLCKASIHDGTVRGPQPPSTRTLARMLAAVG
jgi:hypothetical protein